MCSHMARCLITAAMLAMCSTVHIDEGLDHDPGCDPDVGECAAVFGQHAPSEFEEFEEDVEFTDATKMNLLQHGLHLQKEHTSTDAEGQRALLSKRDATARLGCAYCWCTLASIAQCGASTVTDSAHCGTSWVTSAAQCGTKTITSAATCGTKAFKACKHGRRRRWSGFKCKWKTVTKSCKVPNRCNVPNTCDIANECDVAESFGDCFGEITSGVGKSVRGYLGYITDTGCNSVNSCKNKVLDGLDEVWSLIEEEALSAIPDLVDDVIDSLDSNNILTSAMNKIDQFIDGLGSAFVSISTTVLNYMSGSVPGFTKPDFGSICTPAGTGWWSMAPTDCGAFGKLGDVFTGFENAPSNFNSAVNKFGDCAGKQGLFGFPTPFFNLNIEQYCMPDWLVTAVEYMVGGVAFAANAGQSIATEVSSLIEQIKTFAENDLVLFQIAKEMHVLRHERLGTNLSLAQMSSGCGPQSDWGVDLMLTTGISVPISPTESLNLGLSMGVGLGCSGNNVVDPNWLMYVQLDKSAQGGPSEGISGEVGFEFSFHETYPTYNIGDRVAGKGFLEIVPSLALSIKAVEIGVGVPINFAWVPGNPTAPPGSFTFGTGLAPAGGDVSLAQHDARAGGTTHLEKAQSKMKASFGHLASTLTRKSILEKAAALDEEQGRLLAKAQKQMFRESSKASSTVIEPDLSISSGVNFVLCLTPGACNT